jgi:hypothetical protein
MFFFESLIINKYFLSNYSCDYNNLSFRGFMSYEIVDISLDPIKGYSIKITNNINYFSGFGIE